MTGPQKTVLDVAPAADRSHEQVVDDLVSRRLTARSCSGIDESAGAIADYVRMLEDRDLTEQAEDMAIRLAGPCKRCQEEQGDVLTISGGEAICDECVDDENDDDERETP